MYVAPSSQHDAGTRPLPPLPHTPVHLSANSCSYVTESCAAARLTGCRLTYCHSCDITRYDVALGSDKLRDSNVPVSALLHILHSNVSCQHR